MVFLLGRSTAKGTVQDGSKIRALTFLPGERHRIVIGREDNVLLRPLEENLIGEQIESTGALAVAAARDGQRIVVGSAGGFTIWNTSRDTAVKVAHHSIRDIRAIDISSDSKWVITGSESRTADIWDISTGERHPYLGPLKHDYNVVAVKFCPCGRRIATATLFGSIRIFSTVSGQKIITLPILITVSPTLAVPNVTLAWVANSKRPQLLAVSQGQIKCLDGNNGSVIIQWPLHNVTHPSSVILSPNNKVIAYTVNSSVIIREITTGQQIGDTLKHNVNVSCIAFSPESDRLIVGVDTEFIFYDLRKLPLDTSYFRDTTTEYATSCGHVEQDTVKKTPPTTFDLPLLSIINAAVKPWLHSYLDSAEEVLSNEIEKSTPLADHNVYANRALIRSRLGNGNTALGDAEKSLSLKMSPIGQIAKARAIICQGNIELAMQEIRRVLQTGHSEKHTFLLRVIQCILFCLSGKPEKETSHIINLSEDRKDLKLLLLVQANMFLYEEKYEDAMQSFKKAQVPSIFPYDISPEMWTISYIFGWKFSGLGIQIQQRKCEFLLKGGNSEAADIFLELKNAYQREIVTHAELSSWESAFRRDCLKKLEALGDAALASKNYSEAIKQYKAVEPLIVAPELKYALLLKRSEALAENGKESWEQALKDANEAIKIDSSIPWGFERRHAVLCKCQDYSEAAEALERVISLLGSSKDPKSTELRNQGVKPVERKMVILKIVEDTLEQYRPHILINTKSGRLCNKQKQMETFKGDLEYRKLVLSPTSQIGDDASWKNVVEDYFHYSTLSHTWEDEGEPNFQSVEKISIDLLQPSLPHTKLQMFCSKTREHGYRWAWSDTCCINKADNEVLNASLRSMYQWYAGSSLTIVHLKGVRHQPQLEADVNIIMQMLEQLDELLKDFVECRWNKRAWTLQEYFASKVIHFYTEDWKPYLSTTDCRSNTNLRATNHKNHRAVQRGMELVTRLNAERLATLEPGPDDAREKLRLASGRSAAKKEDVAYSLLGIFKLTIEIIYGDDEAPRTLGRLLERLLSKSDDLTILAWTGKPSEYNSCLPAEITVYGEPESHHVPSPVEETTFLAVIPGMLSTLPSSYLDSAIRLYDRLSSLPLPEFHSGRLKLPCISFKLSSDIIKDPSTHNYIVTSPLLKEVKLKPADDLSHSRIMVLIHPWFRYLQDLEHLPSDSARRENALRLLLGLKQPFGALLLARNNASRDYKRIATEQLIKVQIREDVSPEQLLDNISEALYIR